jgi:hypothetical protein
MPKLNNRPIGENSPNPVTLFAEMMSLFSCDGGYVICTTLSDV